MLADVRQFIETMLLVVAALLPVANPIACASAFLDKTDDLSVDDRRSAAMMVARYGFVLLVASALVGAYVLDFFGLSIPVVQVAGGLIVCSLGWTLLSQEGARNKQSEVVHVSTPADLSSRAFYPLTMPLTVGPGSISVAITLGANVPSGARALAVSAVALATGILLVALSIYFVYAKADTVLKRLGTTGTVIVTRLSAFILFCVGVQIVWNGAKSLLLSLAA